MTRWIPEEEIVNILNSRWSEENCDENNSFYSKESQINSCQFIMK